MLLILFVLTMAAMMVVVALRTWRRGHVRLGDRDVDRTEQPYRFWLGMAGPLAIALMMTIALVRVVHDALTGTGWFSVHGVFDLREQWPYGVMCALAAGTIAWTEGGRRLDARRRRRLRAEI
ncbi:MAG TPA: hypothetical protein VFL14_11670, partial [Xanthomonadales bacterium]|nr:hypothetical protein [Xanthomonadales bacterium]